MGSQHLDSAIIDGVKQYRGKFGRHSVAKLYGTPEATSCGCLLPQRSTWRIKEVESEVTTTTQSNFLLAFLIFNFWHIF